MATIDDLPFETRVRIAREHQFYLLMRFIFRAVTITVLTFAILVWLAIFD